MPVYDQGYRRYEARAPLRRIRFWPIAREALRTLLARRLLMIFALGCWVTALWYVGRIYFVTRFPQARQLFPLDGRLFGEFLNGQMILVLFLTIFTGAGLVANDLRSGAVLVYLSRPLTHRDYILGKLTMLMIVNLSITLAPALVVYGAAMSLAPEKFLDWSLAWIAPAIVAHAIALCLVASLVALALSALARSAPVAGLSYFALMFVASVALGVLRFALRTPALALLSPIDDLRALGEALFGISLRGHVLHWSWSLLVLAAVSIACLAVLRSRVRAVEIVA
jgi:ABC-2 type transport system permease protein